VEVEQVDIKIMEERHTQENLVVLVVVLVREVLHQLLVKEMLLL
tara:strand:+ start:82 stop:213 length:132 start_codon:yes stop_codon:yes gene_type:complete